MKVQIEISDQEAAELRLRYGKGLHPEFRAHIEDTLSVRLAAALPRPIQVGDRVRIHDGERTCVVVAIHEGDAWVRRFSNFSGGEANAFVRVASLTLNEIGAAAALEKETDT